MEVEWVDGCSDGGGSGGRNALGQVAVAITGGKVPGCATSESTACLEAVEAGGLVAGGDVDGDDGGRVEGAACGAGFSCGCGHGGDGASGVGFAQGGGSLDADGAADGGGGGESSGTWGEEDEDEADGTETDGRFVLAIGRRLLSTRTRIATGCKTAKPTPRKKEEKKNAKRMDGWVGNRM